MGAISHFLDGRMPLWRAALALAIIVTFAMVAKTGILFGLRVSDSDDAMRIVQVRDLLAGQGWFDLVQHRVDPPGGLSMHWSRLVDAGLASAMLAFSVVLPPDLAERAAVTAWPALLLFAALLLTGRIAERLGGTRAAPAAMLVFVLLGPALTQFFPGRVDHHNTQIVGTLLCLSAVMRLQDGAFQGWVAGGAAALMLALGIETLPFVAILCAVPALLLIAEGEAGAGRFGLGLVAGTCLAVLALLPGSQTFSASCDAFSAPTIGAALAGGGGLWLASAVVRRSPGRLPSLIAVGLVGAGALGVYATLGPGCLRGPVAAIDPRLFPAWLDGIDEMKPLWPELLRGDVAAVFAVALTVAGLGSAGILMLGGVAPRRAVMLVLVLQIVAFAMTTGQIRSAIYANLFAAPLVGAGLAILAVRLRVPPARWTTLVLSSILGISLPGVVAAAMGPPAAVPSGAAGTTASAGSPGDCLDPETYAELGRLPPGLVLASVDLGPFILLATPHAVLGAPYHRNVAGILTANRLLTLSPAEAEAALRERGVLYVALCGGLPEAKVAGGLASELRRGVVPDWLEKMPAGSALQAFRVR